MKASQRRRRQSIPDKTAVSLKSVTQSTPPKAPGMWGIWTPSWSAITIGLLARRGILRIDGPILAPRPVATAPPPAPCAIASQPPRRTPHYILSSPSRPASPTTECLLLRHCHLLCRLMSRQVFGRPTSSPAACHVKPTASDASRLSVVKCGGDSDPPSASVAT